MLQIADCVRSKALGKEQILHRLLAKASKRLGFKLCMCERHVCVLSCATLRNDYNKLQPNLCSARNQYLNIDSESSIPSPLLFCFCACSSCLRNDTPTIIYCELFMPGVR